MFSLRTEKSIIETPHAIRPFRGHYEIFRGKVMTYLSLFDRKVALWSKGKFWKGSQDPYDITLSAKEFFSPFSDGGNQEMVRSRIFFCSELQMEDRTNQLFLVIIIIATLSSQLHSLLLWGIELSPTKLKEFFSLCILHESICILQWGPG